MAKSTQRGALYLVPCSLGDNGEYVIPEYVKSSIADFEVFIVENLRSARRYLRKIDFKGDYDNMQLFEIGKRSDKAKYHSFLKPALAGKNIGLLSEAGCPGIADPGADIVKIAHQQQIDVKPLVGPSSILLALISSGFNGQMFAFQGYLPIDKEPRIKRIRWMENQVQRNHQTQLFMETPYRNEKMMHQLVAALDDKTQLCVACDLTLDTQFIKTQTVRAWKKDMPNLQKRPTIYVIGK